MKCIESRSIALQKQHKHFDSHAATLQDPFDHDDMGALDREWFAFVQSNASVADAIRAMGQADNCQDAFVTQTRPGKGPLLGWLTDADNSRPIEQRLLQ